MLWRRKLKVHVAPEVDVYIRRRYEDMAVCIHLDIARDMGLYNYYAPWLDYMMKEFDLPDHIRKRNTLVITDSNGQHIGCIGAVKNTLVYYNPLPEQEQARKNRHGSVINVNVQQEFISGDEKSTGKKSNRSDAMAKQHDIDVTFTHKKPATNHPPTQHYKLLHRSAQNLSQSDNIRETFKAYDTRKQDKINRRAGWSLALEEGDIEGDITSKKTSRPQSAADDYSIVDNEFRMYGIGEKAWEEHNKSSKGGGVCAEGRDISGGSSKGDRDDVVLDSTSHVVSYTRRRSRICTIL